MTCVFLRKEAPAIIIWDGYSFSERAAGLSRAIMKESAMEEPIIAIVRPSQINHRLQTRAYLEGILIIDAIDPTICQGTVCEGAKRLVRAVTVAT